jgi:hypothetical protein
MRLVSGVLTPHCTVRRLGSRARAALIVATAALIVACRDSTTEPCAAPTTAAIALTFASGVDGHLIDVTPLVIYERHGDDSVALIRVSTPGAPVLVGSAAGTYDVRVVAAGYHDWLTMDVVVNGSDCALETKPITVFLQPLPKT